MHPSWMTSAMVRQGEEWLRRVYIAEDTHHINEYLSGLPHMEGISQVHSCTAAIKPQIFITVTMLIKILFTSIPSLIYIFKQSDLINLQ